ncbi:hypothetical protein GLP37_13310 [Photobacterium phosphoreum]|uniref:pentapeptide repeat-containing protein n=1 Tax=Photobacterium phosphoreum TaxID=659 RepID=UPI0039F6868D|nr:hypothetical protein [Photobacterium phosphoreum]
MKYRGWRYKGEAGTSFRGASFRGASFRGASCEKSRKTKNSIKFYVTQQLHRI